MEYEKTIRDKLSEDLSVLHPSLKLVKKEYPLDNFFGSKGYIDILATDEYKNFVIIEIKRSRTSSRETLQEILKYVALLRMKHGVRDSEIRIIILSTDWQELLVPYSELVNQSSLSISGYQMFVNQVGGITTLKKIIPESISKATREIAPGYLLDLFFKGEKRDEHLNYLQTRSEEIGVKDFVILTMSAEAKYEIFYPFATVYAFNKLTVEHYKEILKKFYRLDMEPDAFEDADRYIKYLEDGLLGALKTSNRTDTTELSNPTYLDQTILAGKWKVDAIIRAGIFQKDIRLSDEMIIEELRGLRGGSDTKYIYIGDSSQPARIAEIEEKCRSPFKSLPEWEGRVLRCLAFAKGAKRPYRIVVNTFAPRSIYVGICQYLLGMDEEFLPSFFVFLDFYEDNELYVFKGELSWNQRPVEVSKIKGFLEDPRSRGFGKALDLVIGMLDLRSWRSLI